MGPAREGARHQVGVGPIALPFVVPFGADGAADRAARAFARALPQSFGVAVENVPGEGGLAGVRLASSIAREGKPVLLLATPSTHVLLPARLGDSAAPDARFVPLASLGHAPNVLLASPRLAVHDVNALLERARRERLVYASAGTGQTIHLCTAYLCALAGIAMVHRPYDAGSVHAYEDLVAARVHVYFDNLLGCRDAIARGDAIALAISAKERNRLLPDVPTLAECGYPAHALAIWFGAFGAGLAQPVLDAVKSARANAPLRESLHALGLSGDVSDGASLAREIDESREGWGRALESAR